MFMQAQNGLLIEALIVLRQKARQNKYLVDLTESRNINSVNDECRRSFSRLYRNGYAKPRPGRDTFHRSGAGHIMKLEYFVRPLEYVVDFLYPFALFEVTSRQHDTEMFSH